MISSQVILYEMLVGQPPFLANTPAETQYKVVSSSLISLMMSYLSSSPSVDSSSLPSVDIVDVIIIN